MLIPEAWDGNEQMDPAKKAFLRISSHLLWNHGWPAGFAIITDGRMIGANKLDETALRPSQGIALPQMTIALLWHLKQACCRLIPNWIKEKSAALKLGKMFQEADIGKGKELWAMEKLSKKDCSQKNPMANRLNKYKIRF